ncbi:MAG: hypothetical protein LBT20_03555 [Clostridiales bacterium]|jgi:Ca2+/Na+ antiporter|nr:hypothetical protein [Clostridiales bacterium]
MSRESKIIDCETQEQKQITYDNESFGWELLSISENRITMSRETQNPIYNELLKFEIEYRDITKEIEKTKKEKKEFEKTKPNEISSGVAIGIILLIATTICILIAFTANYKIAWIIMSVVLIGFFIAYLLYKRKQINENEKELKLFNTKINEYNQKINLLNKNRKKVCEDSRTTLFSKEIQQTQNRDTSALIAEQLIISETPKPITEKSKPIAEQPKQITEQPKRKKRTGLKICISLICISIAAYFIIPYIQTQIGKTNQNTEQGSNEQTPNPDSVPFQNRFSITNTSAEEKLTGVFPPTHAALCKGNITNTTLFIQTNIKITVIIYDVQNNKTHYGYANITSLTAGATTYFETLVDLGGVFDGITFDNMFKEQYVKISYTITKA